MSGGFLGFRVWIALRKLENRKEGEARASRPATKVDSLFVLSGLASQETGPETQGQPFVAVPVHFPRDQRVIGIQAAVQNHNEGLAVTPENSVGLLPAFAFTEKYFLVGDNQVIDCLNGLVDDEPVNLGRRDGRVGDEKRGGRRGSRCPSAPARCHRTGGSRGRIGNRRPRRAWSVR